ncbi:uncharacterized protein LOC123549013 [Mercenaria mercenaria]|uniref:uncharacterized protein LOC123549013 n=1 Tax=Mercenaria mercenaria TaxID=6596 RepID=UPI00234EA336|nr:uncharacterized protein LOC123549013 [Mercenaria mercenaria]XP_053393761.1 uncharacterized protein LOC123549013 [Mercenaria mercenaria]
MKLVNEYVHETMVPYYKRQLSSATLPREPNVQAPTNNDVQSVIYVEKITTNTAAIIKGGSVLAVDQSIIREMDTIGNYGAVRNKPTKINGRTRKMVHIPTRNLHPDLVREVEKCLGPTETTAPSTPTASATTSTRTTPEILTTSHTPRSTSEPQDSPPTTSATTSTRTTPEIKTTSHTPRSTSEPQDSPPTTSATTSTRTTPEIKTTSHTPRSTSEPQDSPPTTSATTSTPTTPEIKTTSHTPRSTSEPQDSPPTTSATTSTPTTPEIKTTSHTPRSTSETQEAPVSTSLTDQRHTPPAATPLQTVSTHSNKAPVQLVKGKRKLDMLLLPTEVSADELCKKCFKRGRSDMRWVECEICEQWYHATCMEIGRTQYMKIQRNETTWECC